METSTLIEFCAGQHIREASVEAAEKAATGPIAFDWNGEHYEFPQGATEADIRAEYTKRTGHEILPAEVERANLLADIERRKDEDHARNGHLIIDSGVLEKAPLTCVMALELWDAGEYVVTASMGGLGDGYEVCIQCLGFEIIREFLTEQFPTDDEEYRKWWKESGDPRRDAVVSRLNDRFGFSGAQVGAATNLAFCVLRRGYREALSKLPPERLIRARKPAESHKL